MVDALSSGRVADWSGINARQPRTRRVEPAQLTPDERSDSVGDAGFDQAHARVDVPGIEILGLRGGGLEDQALGLRRVVLDLGELSTQQRHVDPRVEERGCVECRTNLALDRRSARCRHVADQRARRRLLMGLTRTEHEPRADDRGGYGKSISRDANHRHAADAATAPRRVDVAAAAPEPGPCTRTRLNWVGDAVGCPFPRLRRRSNLAARLPRCSSAP